MHLAAAEIRIFIIVPVIVQAITQWLRPHVPQVPNNRPHYKRDDCSGKARTNHSLSIVGFINLKISGTTSEEAVAALRCHIDCASIQLFPLYKNDKEKAKRRVVTSVLLEALLHIQSCDWSDQSSYSRCMCQEGGSYCVLFGLACVMFYEPYRFDWNAPGGQNHSFCSKVKQYIVLHIVYRL